MKKKKEGRPSKYRPEYCQEIINYFSPPFFEMIETESGESFYKTGESKYEHTKKQEVAKPLKFISGFAREIGVNQDTLHEWAKVHPEFSEALKEAKELQQEHLVTCGLKGLFNPSFAIFSAKNMIGWRDQALVDNSTHTHFTVILESDKASDSQADGEAKSRFTVAH